MAFVRFCHTRGWIPAVPPVEKLDVDDLMKGRPITSEEFERMLKVTPDVVGSDSVLHGSFATIEKFYGAMRSAQSAAEEVTEKLQKTAAKTPFVGGQDPLPHLSPGDLQKLKALLNAI